MANILTDPPFAADPPVKLNIPAKTLGLVLLILGAIGIILGILGLTVTFGACTVAGVSVGGCGLPILWLLGALIGLIGVCVGTFGAYQMYQVNRDGKRFVIYGLALGLLGSIVTLIGNITFYSGFTGLGVGYGGAIVGLHHRCHRLRDRLVSRDHQPLAGRRAAGCDRTDRRVRQSSRWIRQSSGWWWLRKPATSPSAKHLTLGGPPSGNGAGVASAISGIVALALSWIPFVDYVSLVLGVSQSSSAPSASAVRTPTRERERSWRSSGWCAASRGSRPLHLSCS